MPRLRHSSLSRRLAAMISQPSIERLTGLACLCFIFIVVTSWWLVERHADTSSPAQQRKRQQQAAIDAYLRKFTEKEEEKARKAEELVRQMGEENVVDDLNGEDEKEGERGKIGDRMRKENLDDNSEESNNNYPGQKFDLVDLPNNELGREAFDAVKKVRNDTASSIRKQLAAARRRRLRIKSNLKNASASENPLGKLSGGEAMVKIYSTKAEISDDFECIKLDIKPRTQVCLHEDNRDVHVSHHLRKHFLWEPHILRLFQNYLFANPDVGVYDIGCHVGQYSLLAAVMGHKVVAVDPYMPNLRHLHKGIKLNGVEDKVIVVQNAVSDERETFEIFIPSDNAGGARLTSQDADRFCDEPSCPPHAQTILMDDLLEVTNFRTAILKIDIEGHEHRAFIHSAKLFSSVKIAYVFMEWMKLREYYGSEADSSEDKKLVFDLIELMTSRGYSPRGVVLLDQLSIDYWYGWPDDIVWQHSEASRT